MIKASGVRLWTDSELSEISKQRPRPDDGSGEYVDEGISGAKTTGLS
jgi:hypothetical protein